jgi:hypothetical protein
MMSALRVHVANTPAQMRARSARVVTQTQDARTALAPPHLQSHLQRLCSLGLVYAVVRPRGSAYDNAVRSRTFTNLRSFFMAALRQATPSCSLPTSQRTAHWPRTVTVQPQRRA